MGRKDREQGDGLRLRMPAKLNLALDVLGLREDGYHEIETVMQAISIYDELTIRRRAERGITLSSSLPFLPLDARNLAYRAAVAFFEEIEVEDYGIEIAMKKRIPVGAGMGGGSANAAGVLLGLNRLYGAKLSMEQLSRIGLRLGADVPFCLLAGGAALACGSGEKLTPLPSMPHCTLVVAKPKASISTPVLYQKYDSCGTRRHPDCAALSREMGGDLRRVAALCGNALEQAAAQSVPMIATMAEQLTKLGAIKAVMTGSGSAVFGIFVHNGAARAATLWLRKEHPGCFVSLSSPIERP